MLNEIEAIQKDLLLLLKYIHELCVTNGIQYSLHGGTMLGAVREKGFIPWDDDVDISFDRDNYDRFNKLMQTYDLPMQFAFNTDNRFPQFIMKIDDHPAVWADIFVYDYISERPFFREFKILLSNFFVIVTRDTFEQKLSNLVSIHKGIKIVFMNILMYGSKIIPKTVRLKQAWWFMSKFPGNRTLVHRSNDVPAGIKLIIPVNAIRDYTLIDFCGEKLMVFRDYDTILESCYGSDYMVPIKMGNDAIHTLSFDRHQKVMEKYVLDRQNKLSNGG